MRWVQMHYSLMKSSECESNIIVFFKISLIIYSYYCPANGSFSEGIECPMGHYCPMGTHLQNQYPCSAGTINPHTRMASREDCLPCPPGTISTVDWTPIESFLRVMHLLFSEGDAALLSLSIGVTPFSATASCAFSICQNLVKYQTNSPPDRFLLWVCWTECCIWTVRSGTLLSVWSHVPYTCGWRSRGWMSSRALLSCRVFIPRAMSTRPL